MKKYSILSRNRTAILSISLLTGALLTSCGPAATKAGEDNSRAGDNLRWVYPGEDGKLIYEKDARGNRIPDFSNAGYMGGGVALPDVPVRATVRPGEGDDGERIQAAIDQVAQLDLDENGFRGAVLLERGQFQVADSIHIRASGIVLRGEGQDEGDTIIRATGTRKRDVIIVAGEGRPRELDGTRRRITETYVPVGATSFRVENLDGYSVGDAIAVFRPSTAEWISELGMDKIPPRRDGLPVTQWTAGSRDFYFDRVITAIDGDRVTLDAPIFNALEEAFGGGYIFKYAFPGRISQVGVEHLRGISDFAGAAEEDDEDHAWTFIRVDAAENAWVRNITSYHFGFGLASITRHTKWVTVQDSICLEPVSQVRGGRRYPIYLHGQFGLVMRCYANYSRHDFGLSSLVPGPNVFVDCFAEKTFADSGPHHRWAAGALFDNVRIPDHSIRIINRLNLGSGHGWAGANMVIWNSEADHFMIQNPPTAQNWMIGSIGEIREPSFWGDPAYIVSHGMPVEPKSLYLAQLRERLGDEAVRNISQMDIREPIQIRPELWE
jgi:hypothetical protein